MAGTAVTKRPKYLDLFRIRLPLPGIISILHRISGAILFLLLPLLLYVFQQSLDSFNTYDALATAFQKVWVKVIVFSLLWGYFHHVCAGVRHLLLDFHIGTALGDARQSSRIVLVAGVVLTFVTGVLLW